MKTYKPSRCKYCLSLPSKRLGQHPCSCSGSGSHSIQSYLLLVIRNRNGHDSNFSSTTARSFLSQEKPWQYIKSILNPNYR